MTTPSSDLRRRAKLELIRLRFLASRLRRREPTLRFRCNVCGRRVRAPLSAVREREAVSCSRCGSSLRYRSLVHALSQRLFGEDLTIPDFPAAPARCGMGTSDEALYAGPLAQRLDFRNTWYHQEPICDVSAPPAELMGRFDFVLCSDVLEHVEPPVARAFGGLFALLKPGGSVILTVPYRAEGALIEHYPDLHDWRVEETDGRMVLHNRTADGREQTFEHPVFHGGPGTTLEMRFFSRPSLRAMLEGAGFTDVREHREEAPHHGIVPGENPQVPWSARRPEPDPAATEAPPPDGGS